MTRLVGVFGGTFDPVHCGHLRTVLELRDTLGLDEVRVIPCGMPPHRAPPVASPAARLAMLEIALRDLDGCVVDRCEIDRAGPSWTVETLAGLREQDPGCALVLLLGQDAFLGLPGWHRWREVFDRAHVAVARRPGVEIEPGTELVAEVKGRKVQDAASLRGAVAGKVIFCETSQLDISSSHLRSLAARRKSLRWLVPDAVGETIEANGWYR